MQHWDSTQHGPDSDHISNAYRTGEAIIEQSAQVISATGEVLLDGTKVVAGALRDGGQKFVSEARADISEIGADITSEFHNFQFTPQAGETWGQLIGRLWFIAFLMMNVLILLGATIYIFVAENSMFIYTVSCISYFLV